MIQKLIRGYVEGVGSKTIAFVLLAIGVAILAPILFARFGISVDLTREILYGLGATVAAVIAKQLAVDVKSGGQTTTQYLMTQQALIAAERVLPDHTKLDAIVKEVLLAMSRAQTASAGATPGALTAVPVAPVAAVPQTPPSP